MLIIVVTAVEHSDGSSRFLLKKSAKTNGWSRRWFVFNGKTGKDSMVRKPADPEEELRWMSQEVRGYVEAVLNSLAANVPKAVVLCQVEKAKEDMLNQLYSSISALSTARIEELIQEDQNVKHRRERIQRQSSLLSKLTRQLSIHDNRAAAASSWSNGGGGAENSPRTTAPPTGDDWRSAFDAAANGSVDSYDDSSRFSRGHSRRYSDPAQNGDSNSSSSSNSSSRRTPNRLPPAPPQSALSASWVAILRGHGQPQYLHKCQEHESNENKGVLSIPVDILMLTRRTFSTWTCLVCPCIIFRCKNLRQQQGYPLVDKSLEMGRNP